MESQHSQTSLNSLPHTPSIRILLWVEILLIFEGARGDPLGNSAKRTICDSGSESPAGGGASHARLVRDGPPEGSGKECLAAAAPPRTAGKPGVQLEGSHRPPRAESPTRIQEVQRRPAGAPRSSSAPLLSGGAEASSSGPPAPEARPRARAADTLHSLPSPRAARRRGELRAKWRGAVSSHAAPGCAPYLFQVALAQARRCCVPRSSAPAAPGSLLPRSLRLGELMNFNLRRVLMLTPAHARSASPTTILGCLQQARRPRGVPPRPRASARGRSPSAGPCEPLLAAAQRGALGAQKQARGGASLWAGPWWACPRVGRAGLESWSPQPPKGQFRGPSQPPSTHQEWWCNPC